MRTVIQWFNRQLANPQITILGGMLLGGFLVIYFMGGMLAPFLAALVISYLLDGIVMAMQRLRIPRLVSVIAVFSGFVVSIVFLVMFLVPAVINQLELVVVREVPKIIKTSSNAMDTAFKWYEIRREKLRFGSTDENGEKSPDENGEVSPDENGEESPDENGEESPDENGEVSPDENGEAPPDEAPPPVRSEDETWKETLVSTFGQQIQERGNEIINVFNFNSFKKLVTWIVYLVLVPVLVFFMLKDKERLIAWFVRFLPPDRSLAIQVWQEVNVQISNYIRGKFWEIIIVWGTTNITFGILGLNQAFLLSLFVGLSVMVPYVGATLMYIPIALAAYSQFGFVPLLFWTLVAYTIIQILDGNLLVPVLLSEVTSLHPVGIIVAILVCGGLWGFWGVFFAIPLATLFNAVLNAWPKDLPGKGGGTPSPA